MPRNPRKMMIVLMAAAGLLLLGCGDSGGGGDASAGNKSMEDIAAALDEEREACSDLLEAGEVFTSGDVETCSAAGRGGYECEGDGTDAWGIDDHEGESWIIAEGERPVRASEVDDLWSLFLKRCPDHS